MRMRVPFVNLKPQFDSLKAEITAAVQKVIETQSFILGENVERFEKAAAAYLGVKHAIGVANGSDALYLALLAIGIEPGDEVVTSTFTYVATPGAIVRAGAKLRLCDINLNDYCLDPASLKRCVTPQTKAVIPVHLYGQCADLDAVRAVMPKGAFMIEDAAQCWGATFKGRMSGGLGHIGCFSFYPTKTLGAAGDAGLVTTNDDGLAERLRLLRVHGEAARYTSVLNGINSRLDAMQAAILYIKLGKIDQWNTERQRIAAAYRERLSGLALTLPEVRPGNVHVWHQFVIRSRARDRLKAHLDQSGIGNMIYYPIAQHTQKCFAHLGFRDADFPNVKTMCAECLALPCWPGMSEGDIEAVTGAIRAFKE